MPGVLGGTWAPVSSTLTSWVSLQSKQSAVGFGEEAREPWRLVVPLGTWCRAWGSEAGVPRGCAVAFLEPIRAHSLGTPLVSGQSLLPAVSLEVAGGVWTPLKASSRGVLTGLVLLDAEVWRPEGGVGVPPGLLSPGPCPARSLGLDLRPELGDAGASGSSDCWPLPGLALGSPTPQMLTDE